MQLSPRLRHLYFISCAPAPTTAARHRKRYRSPCQMTDKRPRSAAPAARKRYVRPAAAIERGGGFYLPGISGARLRQFAGVTVLSLLLVNHGAMNWHEGAHSLVDALLTPPAWDEWVSVLAAATLLGVGLAEQRVQQKIAAATPASAVAAPSPSSPPASADAQNTDVDTAASAAVAFVLQGIHSLFDESLPYIAVILRPDTRTVVAHTVSAGAGALRLTDDAPVTLGEVIARVLQARRGIYLDRFDSVPASVEFPFIAPARPASAVVEWCGDNAGTPDAASALILLLASTQPDAFPAAHRRWLRALSRRLH
ncbi:hypothetical protein CDCA_CDCA12G3333 [Cyanidium caldarium]|uniref:Uncharacterized protein n=1 Tax=Cyanidium caldarium TaxID=2771 RepID=A0AAV9IYX3_CYACA|nr:hypothetical protein CDCA_CDCA12G3333 [Cyanidium caldarium]